MPVVSVNRDLFFQKLGENWGAKPNQPSDEADRKFDELCFDFGIELDDVTSEKEIKQKELAKKGTRVEASDSIIYKVEVPANRYDILCIEGLSRALRIFKEKQEPPTYRVIKPNQPQKMIIKRETHSIRPHVVCAVLRNVNFDEHSYQSFIDLQEKLHQNICRKRTLVSIGTHDLDTIKGPFTYEALPPKEINFVPLNGTQSFDGEGLMNHLDKDLHLKKFLPIIRNSPVYPVIYDSNRTVLSLPPIINSDHSKITLKTKNVFIEVTATDHTKAEIVLNTMCAMFAEYSADKFSVEAVEVVDAAGNSRLYPDLSSREFDVSVDYINNGIGINISGAEMVKLLKRMTLGAVLAKDGKSIRVSVPCTRSDVLSACDVMEDVAIAYGFNNIQRELPRTLTTGAQRPVNKLTDLLRSEIAMAGFTEVLTFVLCSRKENFTALLRPDDGTAVTLANPQSIEFDIARTTLLPGILKTLWSNKDARMPLTLFELSDVVFKDATYDVGARNQRNLSAVYCGTTSGFEVIHGLLDRVMLLLRVAWAQSGAKAEMNYELQPSEDPAFLPGRRADVLLNGQKIGVLGVVHPKVLKQYEELQQSALPFVCSAFEINIEPFV